VYGHALVVLSDERDDVSHQQSQSSDDEPETRLERLAGLRIEALSPEQFHAASLGRGVLRSEATGGSSDERRLLRRRQGTAGVGTECRARLLCRECAEPRSAEVAIGARRFQQLCHSFPLNSLVRPLDPSVSVVDTRAVSAGCNPRADENAAISSTFDKPEICC
jgi:hypothetical protein